MQPPWPRIEPTPSKLQTEPGRVHVKFLTPAVFAVKNFPPKPHRGHFIREAGKPMPLGNVNLYKLHLPRDVLAERHVVVAHLPTCGTVRPNEETMRCDVKFQQSFPIVCYDIAAQKPTVYRTEFTLHGTTTKGTRAFEHSRTETGAMNNGKSKRVKSGLNTVA